MNGLRSVGSKGVADEQDYDMGIQIIDENKDFTDKLPDYLQHHNLYASGFNYHIVAVFGSQSTGKSTLLNHLFQTKFSVMDESSRQQTTKGIWMAKAIGGTGSGHRMADNILVMDVEGTDGRERGEDQDFERKSALFALATAEVLIVNIWEHQVGLYHGANMGLLKTVFEVNLQLFGKSTKSKSLLFFVIRDYMGKTPIEKLAGMLRADLEKIWESLSKPSGLENAKIDDFFHFDYAGLPHKIWREDDFIRDARALSTRFREPDNTEELEAGREGSDVIAANRPVFLPVYHRGIPADGFSQYASSIWEQIVTNKDLDLPTQQELLAQYRCEEISTAVTKEIFDPIITPLETKGSGTAKVLPGLGEDIVRARGETLEKFSVEAGRYFKPVYHKKKEELEQKLDGRLKALVLLHFQGLHKRAVNEFEEEVNAYLKKSANSSNIAENDFKQTVDVAKESAIERFKAEAEPCFIEGCTWSSYEDELTQTNADIDVVAARLRGEELRRLRLRIEKGIRSKLAEPVEVEFQKLGNATGANKGDGLELWDNVWHAFEKVVNDGVKHFLAKADALNATKEENEVSAWKLRSKGWSLLRAKIDEELMEGNILMKLRENFEDRFRYDESGVPRVWKPADDIEGLYTSAREETDKLIPLISTFKLNKTGFTPPLAAFIGERPTFYVPTEEDDEDEISFETLSEARQISLRDRFKKTADSIYLEAKRSTISSVAQVPVWMYGLLLALGWNEIWAVIRSPMYFFFLLLCGAVAYVAHSLNLWGPMVRVGNAMMTQSVDIGRERLREFLENSKAPSERLKESGYEMSTLKKRNTGKSDGSEGDREGAEDW